MAVSKEAKENLGRPSWIRRMFEEGEKLRASLGPEAVYDFSLGNPDIEPPAAFRAALEKIVADPSAGRHGYMANAGYLSVREAVARKASAEQGLTLGAGNIVMSVGAAGGLNVVLKSILDPGDEVIVIKPYFAEYIFYIQNYQGVFTPIDAGPGFSLSAENLRKALTPRTAAVILNSPNNPTGVIYSKEELAAAAKALLEHGNACGRYPYLIADEPYRTIVYGGASVASAMEAYPETIVVSSWSKSLSLPGERIGYIAISPRCADARDLFAAMAMNTRSLGFVNAPALMQRAVAELLDESADVASYARRGAMLGKGLRAAGYEFPEPRGAFYFFVRVPKRAGHAGTVPVSATAGGSDVDFAMHLKKYNIIVVPGEGFGCPGWFRISYCVSERAIKGAIPLFAKALEEWKAGK